MVRKPECGLVALVAGAAAWCLGLGVTAALARAAEAPSADAVQQHRERLGQYALRHDGSAEQGRKLFWDDAGPGCASCHTVGKDGGSFGPDLSDLADKYDRAEIIRSVLHPSDRIAAGYQRVTVITADGRVVAGRLVADTAGYVEVRTRDGVVRVERDQVESFRPDARSEMPEGLADDLSAAQFADLVSYLTTLKNGTAE
jgi:putative heme-binding domain-containing protein